MGQFILGLGHARFSFGQHDLQVGGFSIGFLFQVLQLTRQLFQDGLLHKLVHFSEVLGSQVVIGRADVLHPLPGVAYIGYGMRWLKRAETEVADARQWMQNIGTAYNDLRSKYLNEMNQLMQQPVLEQLASQLEDLKQKADRETANLQVMLAEAEARVAQAETKLSQASDSPDYRNAKAAASVVLGLMLGVVVATVGQIKMFALLGIAMPARIDVFATGIVIGSGSYPVHSLVGILQQGRDALDGLGNFLNQRSAPAVSEVEQTITTVQPAGPGQPPIVGQAVIQTTTAQSSPAAAGG